MLGEHVSARLWIGFGIVWVALVLLTVDSLHAANAARNGRRAQGPGAAEAPEPCP